MKKRTLLSLAIANALMGVSSANAQTEENPVVEQDSAVEEVVVSASRIKRDGFTAPTPVTVASTDDLMNMQPTNIPDALNKLPQFQLSSSPAKSQHNFSNTASHGNLLNLRGVGSKRTLILMDGMRMPKTTFLGDVDVNVMPNLLMQRVEVVTGGASAAYGSDAVSGVVNFIVDDSFVGTKLNIQGGVSEQGDNEHNRIGVATGFEFSEGNGHVLLSAERYDSDGMMRNDRDASRQGWIFAGSNPNCVSANASDCVPGGALNPYKRYKNGRLTVASDYGLISGGPAGFSYNGQRFDQSGNIVPFDPGTATGSPIYASGGDGYTVPFDVTGVAPLTTEQLFGKAIYDFSNGVRGYVQGLYSSSEVEYTSLANSLVGATSATIYGDNAYLPAALQAELAPTDSFKLAHYLGTGPKPYTEEETEFMMFAAGLDGDINESWSWGLDISHGESEHTMDQSGLYNWQRTYAALDAVDDGTGNIVCRASLSADPAVAARFADCKPMNIMSGDPSIATPEGYAYATGTSSYVAKTTQDLIAFEVTGSAFTLPAGPVDMAFGAEWRTEDLKLRSNADPALLDEAAERDEHFAGLRGVPSSALHYWLTNIGVADGSVDVWEAFAEVNVPVIAGRPGFEQLDLNAAVRHTDYSTSGPVDTWKLGMTWRTIDEVLLRATVSRDIRAPSLFNLYAGDQSTISTIFDPQTGLQDNIPQVNGGNRDLEPEEADTFTFGVVYTPQAVPGLSLSIDYYSIEIQDAIGALSAQQIVNNCFQSGGAECALVTRPDPNALPTEIRIASANIASLETSGIDIDVSYATPVGPGNLSVRLYANYLEKYQTQQYAGAPVIEYAGVAAISGAESQGRPEWTGTLNVNYDVGNFGLTLSEQYIGKMEIGYPGSPSNFVDGDVDPEWYTDLTGRYRMMVGNQGGEMELFGTINNLFDNEAPIIPGTTPGATYPTLIGTYDYVGRAFTVGMRYTF